MSNTTQAQAPQEQSLANKVGNVIDKVLHPNAAQSAKTEKPAESKTKAAKDSKKVKAAKAVESKIDADPILGVSAESYDVEKVNNLDKHISRARFKE